MKREFAGIFLVLGLLVAFASGYAEAQTQVTSVWEIETEPEAGWTIGDPIKMRLVITSPVELDVSVPQLPSEWGPFEVSEQALLDAVSNDDRSITSIREVTVIPWSTGELETPPIEVQYRDSDDRIHDESVPAMFITIGSTLIEDDTEKRDLKPQASLDLAGSAIWPWILGGIASVAVLAAVLWWLWKRRRNRELSESDFMAPVDDRFPEEIAYDELERVAELNLPVKGEFKRHYDMVTDCIRNYLEGVYLIPAMEQTTGEIMLSVRKLNEPKSNEITPSLKSLLEESDLVKFAKYSPTVDSAAKAVKDARLMVDITRPVRDSVAEETEEPIAGTSG